jgi:RNA polymerase sigma-70 factor (ECF subfamily)
MLTLMTAGDEDTFGESALACADALYRLARHLTGNASEAEDLVQETYARAFGASHQFAAGTNLRAWLMRILRNAFLDQRRRAKNDPTSARLGDVEPAPIDPRHDDADVDAFRRVVAEEVAAAMADLSEEHRTAILLDVEGLTETEVATVLDCSIGTVKSRLSRARAALRARLRTR